MFKKGILFRIILIAIQFGFLQKISLADPEIKSLKVYSYNDQTSIPIINGESGSLTIEFDIKNNSEPMFRILFKFCDRDWNPYDNIFLMNNGYNTVYPNQLFFKSLPAQIKEADFHFKQSFPNERASIDFPFSGKWKFFITDSDDESKVYAEGRFIVAKSEFEINPEIHNETLEKIFFPTDLNRVFKINIDIDLPDNFIPLYVQGIEIIENQKIDYPYFIDRNNNNDYHAFYWDGNRKMSFMSKEIKPGNSYRETDLRNTNKFTTKQVNAQFDGVETSSFFVSPKEDLKGGSIVPEYSEEFATYLDVNFMLRLTPDITSDRVFVVGAFNNWGVLPQYELRENDGLYTTTIQLKRGVYDYQYVTAELNNGKISNIDWNVLEGNTWDVQKNYNIILWYSDPDKGRYDRIISYKQITSK